MPFLFKENELSEWYQLDIHLRVKKYFKKFFPEEMIFVSSDKVYPLKGKVFK